MSVARILPLQSFLALQPLFTLPRFDLIVELKPEIVNLFFASADTRTLGFFESWSRRRNLGQGGLLAWQWSAVGEWKGIYKEREQVRNCWRRALGQGDWFVKRGGKMSGAGGGSGGGGGGGGEAAAAPAVPNPVWPIKDRLARPLPLHPTNPYEEVKSSDGASWYASR